MSSFTFGSDPEFMLKKGNRYVSAISVIGADQHNPVISNGNSFYWDNVLAECTVKPSRSKEEAVANISECLRDFVEIVSPNELVVQASQNYPKSIFQDKEAKIAGCQPDNCVYQMMLMKGDFGPNRTIENNTFRTCGGHVHVGLQNEDGKGLHKTPLEMNFMIYLLDLFLGVPSIFMDCDPTAKKRRTLYGQAGRFRYKSYGVEYRSLSSFWLTSPILVELVYDIIDFVIGLVENDQTIIQWDEDLHWELDEDLKPTGDAYYFSQIDKHILKQTIDNSDKTAAKKFLPYIQEHMPVDLFARLKKEMSKRKSYSLYKEWSLK